MLDAINKQTCIDSGYNITLADRLWLLALLPQVEIRKIALLLRIKGLGLLIYNTDKYILVLIFIPIIKDGVPILYRILREIYLVDNLKAYILIENDIIGLE